MCASVTTDLLLRARISRAAPVALVVPVMIFVAAFVAGAGAPDAPSYPGPALLVVLALAALACRAPLEVQASPSKGVPLRVRPTVGIAAAAAAAIVASSVAAFVLPARTRGGSSPYGSGLQELSGRPARRHCISPFGGVGSCGETPVQGGPGRNEQRVSRSGGHGGVRRRVMAGGLDLFPDWWPDSQLTASWGDARSRSGGPTGRYRCRAPGTDAPCPGHTHRGDWTQGPRRSRNCHGRTGGCGVRRALL